MSKGIRAGRTPGPCGPVLCSVTLCLWAQLPALFARVRPTGTRDVYFQLSPMTRGAVCDCSGYLSPRMLSGAFPDSRYADCVCHEASRVALMGFSTAFRAIETESTLQRCRTCRVWHRGVGLVTNCGPVSWQDCPAFALPYHTLHKYELTKTGKSRYFRLSSGSAYDPV